MGSAYVQKKMMELRGQEVEEKEILAIVQPISNDSHDSQPLCQLWSLFAQHATSRNHANVDTVDDGVYNWV